jgi:hypothetical protein
MDRNIFILLGNRFPPEKKFPGLALPSFCSLPLSPRKSTCCVLMGYLILEKLGGGKIPGIIDTPSSFLIISAANEKAECHHRGPRD